ncbi:hypothetical protein [Paenibacillus sp. P3E]|uniref:hypothetical protein n=1 Tax=Paenibacillus sp. P3E TaxID=1349435 RepID=UPI000AECF972|nr:hypothetical protein [Paenibacillus sp. P3E]
MGWCKGLVRPAGSRCRGKWPGSLTARLNPVDREPTSKKASRMYLWLALTGLKLFRAEQ